MDHIEKLKNAVKNSDVGALFLFGEADRLYATGFRASDGAVVVTADKAYFMTDSRYIEAARTQVQNAEVLEVGGGKRYSTLINEITSSHHIKKLGFEENVLTYGEYTAFKDLLHAKLVPAQNTVSALRASKDEHEIELMIKAQRIAEAAFEQILPVISTDVTEKELAAELVYRMVRAGAEKESFDTICVSGEKSSMPHGVPEAKKIGKGFLTIDFGAVYEGYCSDTTRTVCVGQPTDEMKKVYDIVLRAQKAGIEAARAGVLGADIDKAARDIIAGEGYGEFFGHSFGHSLGIEIHESPNASPSCTTVMPEGAVISAEPGIYLPGKFGVRIEDVLILDKNGCRDITNLTKELIIL